MAEIDDHLAELRHRIMGFENGPPKPVQPQHQETNAEGLAVTGPVNIDYQRHGSAAVALRRLAHPKRDGGGVVEADLYEPINPDSAAVAEDNPISQLITRLSLDMPELMEEVVAFIERRTAELNGDNGAAPKPTESAAPAALVRTTPTLQDDDTGTATINLRFDTQVLARIDADAKRRGINRTTWLHIAAGERLQDRR